MFAVIVSPEAKSELVAAAIFLEENRSGYGDRFVKADEETLELLQVFPFKPD